VTPGVEVSPQFAISVPDRRRTTTLIFLVILSLLYGFVELVPGRFTAPDEVFYKAAGRNWAMTGRFAAPEIVGRLTKGPPLTEVYFAQPPVYTFLFGVYTKLVGFGPRACILYDVLIHLLLVWSVVAVSRRVFHLSWGLSALCGVLFIPLGTVGRSDELAIVFALCATMALRCKTHQTSGALLGGALLGLCCATSLSAFVFLGPLVLWELLGARQPSLRKLRDLGAAGAAGLAAAAFCVAPILINHPTAYQQLIAHAGDQQGIPAFLAGNGWTSMRELFQTWSYALRDGLKFEFLVCGLLGFAALCWWVDGDRSRLEYQRILAAALSVSGIVLLMPGKFNYLWFPGSWLLVTCVALGAQVSQVVSRQRRRWLIAVGASVWLVASMWYFHRKAILWTLPGDQSLSVNMKRVRAEIPPNVGVVTTEYWWALAGRDRVYDVLLSNPNVHDVDYVIVSGNGSGKPGTPLNMNGKYENSDFKVVYNHLNRNPASLFGFQISRSAYGFGPYVLKKQPGRLTSTLRDATGMRCYVAAPACPASLSGHTAAITKPTAIPMDTSMNR
jgi:hypothetical protein